MMNLTQVSGKFCLSLVALFAVSLPFLFNSACAMGAERAPTFCNPLDLPYCFQDGVPSWRTAADPAIVVYQGEYWLFATGSGGYWHSTDLIHWKLVTQTGLPLTHDAPGVLEMGGRLYWTAIGTGIYETEDPAGGDWKLVGDTLSQGDPDLFQDDDGRVYLYTGCGVEGPISGQEVDPKNGFKPLTEQTRLLAGMTATHGGEIFAEPTAGPPYKDNYAWIEGAWMTKHGGKYYLQYAAPATELKAYGDSVYVSDHPLGPFTYAPYSPFSFKPTGFMGSAGHSATFQDLGGRSWRISTMTISVRNKFERRLGIFPTWFTSDGQMVCDTSLGDYPQYAPGVVKDPSQGNRPSWMLLSYRKPAKASSTLDSHPVGDAFDEDIRTWWSAKTGDPGEWLQADLGKPCRIEAVQVNFADEGAAQSGHLQDGYGYKLDVSANGTRWTTIVDRSARMRDAPHDYTPLDKPVTARYARITNTHSPAGAKFSLSGLRLFGSGLSRAPQQATGIQVLRNASDGRQATIVWRPASGADGYIVRYGIAKDKLFSSYQVYDAHTLHIHTLNTGVSYFFTVDSFNDSGVTPGAAITPLAAAALPLPPSAHAQNQSVTPYEADASFDAYNAAFLVQSNGHTYYANGLTDRSPAFLWGQALDIVVAEDAFERTHTPARQQLVKDLVSTFVANNPGVWSWDGWNDDIAWSCIACIRGYQITGDGAFLNAAASNWNMAYNRGWDDVAGGGIWENQDKHTKNPLSNDPFVISGCALYAATGDATFLTRSENIYNWVHNYILDTKTGQVNGARTAAGELQTSDNAYDSGAFIEAANCLHQVTGNSQYYNDSLLAINHIVNQGPVLHNNGEDSSNAWAYWFTKGLSDVCTDNNLWAQYYPWMLGNANAAWAERNSANLTWNDWTSTTNLAKSAALTVSSAVAVWQALNVPAQSLIVNHDSGLALDLIGGSAANNAVINQSAPSKHPDGTQRWMVVPTPNGHTAIISAATGMAAAISAGSTSNGAPLVDGPYTTGDNSQQWDLVSQGGGWYSLRNVRSGLVLAASGQGKANGSQIVQWSLGGIGAAKRLWKLQPLVSFAGNYEIQSVSSDLALDVSGGSTSSGAPIVQKPYEGRPNQLWHFTPTSRGYYRIRSVSSGQALNVTGSSFFNRASLVQLPAGSTVSDQWFPAQNSDGTYTFYNLNSSLVLDNPSGTTSGAAFDQWVTNGGTNQEFNVIPRTAPGSQPRLGHSLGLHPSPVRSLRPPPAARRRR